MKKYLIALCLISLWSFSSIADELRDIKVVSGFVKTLGTNFSPTRETLPTADIYNPKTKKTTKVTLSSFDINSQDMRMLSMGFQLNVPVVVTLNPIYGVVGAVTLHQKWDEELERLSNF